MSLFEEDHPNNEAGDINASVFWHGPEHAETKYKEGVTKPIFRYELIENCPTWKDLFENVANEVKKQGGQSSRYLIDCCNDTNGDSNIGVVFHWLKALEEADKDVVVTARGECCTIF